MCVLHQLKGETLTKAQLKALDEAVTSAKSPKKAIAIDVTKSQVSYCCLLLPPSPSLSSSLLLLLLLLLLLRCCVLIVTPSSTNC
jgi:hypothetical protein